MYSKGAKNSWPLNFTPTTAEVEMNQAKVATISTIVVVARRNLLRKGTRRGQFVPAWGNFFYSSSSLTD